ncbi:MAG: glucose-6-phosphate isomerase, partial [Oscillospiraceae bacterium]|nr:glucose-6-phosphate isomerase [Oscillospiraceae bacterium]
GGRYSVLTAVGLLPMAAAGLDIDQILSGARETMEALSQPSMRNPAWQYAAVRNLLYETGTRIEILACYEPSFRFMGEWWKQLFGESEGKDGVGLFPASVEYTADLHSMGQYVQDGQRILMETVVQFQKSRSTVYIPYREDDGDGLNFLAGHTVSELAEQAMEGTSIAHLDGGVPNLKIQVPERNERCFGALVYFFELSCALSGYLMGVNPFNQPGVEAYKRNMFALLGKPGYETLQAELQNRIHG